MGIVSQINRDINRAIMGESE